MPHRSLPRIQNGVRCTGFSALSKVPPCSTAWWHDLCHMAQVFAMRAFSLQRPRATKKGSRLCRFLKTVSEDDQLKLPMFTSCAAGTREQRSDKSIYAAPAKGKKQFHERASRGMQHESAAQACTHIRSVPAESGAKVIKVFPRKHACGRKSMANSVRGPY